MHMLPDGRRLHLHDGPIDLIVEAYGRREQIHAAYDSAARRFVTILDELCAELPLLRQAVGKQCASAARSNRSADGSSG